eukprot:CFRG5170T1
MKYTSLTIIVLVQQLYTRDYALAASASGSCTQIDNVMHEIDCKSFTISTSNHVDDSSICKRRTSVGGTHVRKQREFQGRELSEGQRLYTGENLISDCTYRAELFSDGLKLIEYSEAGTTIYWSLTSSLLSSPIAFMKLDFDGYLRFYTDQGATVWQSETDFGKGATAPYRMKLMNDGNLVIIDSKQRIRWETNTVHKSCKNSELWNDFVAAKRALQEPALFDYSYAGYRYSETPLPDMSLVIKSLKVFLVTDYGCEPVQGYCDTAFQTAIDLATSVGGGIIYFPEGTYYLGQQNLDVSNMNARFVVRSSNIIIKGAGVDRTNLHFVGVDGRSNFWNVKFEGRGRIGAKVEVMQLAFIKASNMYIQVKDRGDFKDGDCVVISQDGDNTTKETWFEGEPYDSKWNNPYIRILTCITRITNIDGTVFFELQEPLPFSLHTALGAPTITVQRVDYLEEIGVESLTVTSEWKAYPEEFCHRCGGVAENGWNIISLEFVRNAWIRDVYFDSVSGAVNLDTCMAVTVIHTWVKGKKGHYGFISRRGRGVLFKENKSAQHHGTSIQSSDINAVILRDVMDVGQSIDFHGKYASRTLMDQVEGGILSGNGGHLTNLPHHAKGLTLWNFIHRGRSDEEKTRIYDFWPQLDLRLSVGKTSVYQTTNLIFEAVVAGLQGDAGVSIDRRDLLLYESLGAAVQPASLFEAQLAFRLSDNKVDLSPEI